MAGNIGSYRKEMIRVNCTDTGKSLDAELVRMEKDKIHVILPGYIKMTLHKTSKPHLYTANQGGMEFTCDTKNR